QAPAANSTHVAQFGRPQNSLAPNAASNLPRQENQIAGGLRLPTLKSGQATKRGQMTAGPAPQKPVADPSASAAADSAPAADSSLAQNTISTTAISELPLNGRNVTDLQRLQPAEKGAAAQNNLAREKELPALQIQGASVQAQTLAGISGRITDRTGATIGG